MSTLVVVNYDDPYKGEEVRLNLCAISREVFACHLGVYTHAGADFPIQFATESMFWDGFSITSLPITAGSVQKGAWQAAARGVTLIS